MPIIELRDIAKKRAKEFESNIRMDTGAIVDYTIDLILKEISRRTGYTLSQLRYCLPEDIEKILSGKKINKNILNKRRKYRLIYFTKME